MVVAGRKSRVRILLGIAALDIAAVLLAVPWFLAAVGDIPFAAPWPAGYLVVALIAVSTALLDLAIWIATRRTG